MISKSIFKRNLEGLTYKEKTEIRINDLNQEIEQKDNENKKLKRNRTTKTTNIRTWMKIIFHPTFYKALI